MPYFLAGQKIISGQEVALEGDEVAHIVLAKRAKKGEKIKLQGTDGKRYLAEIKEIKRNLLKLVVLDEIPVPAESEAQIVLLQAVVANTALETILQKATELGAAKIILFNSQFTATRLSKEKFSDKLQRFQKILWEAAKQSERAKIPELEFVENLDSAISIAEKLDKIFLFDISGQKLKVESKKLKVGLIIGPEGGLSDEELNKIKKIANCSCITLGPILLKADTAAVSALALISNL